VIIIGIDPGTRITGYGIIRWTGQKAIAIDYGCIRPKPTSPLSDRYFFIYCGVKELVCRHKPSALSIESQYVQLNAQSALKLGMANGAILIAAKEQGIPVFKYAPSKVKQAVVGNGSASKEQVQGMMQLLLGLATRPEPEDAADALALAMCHAQSMNSPLGLKSKF
jgi:crossover junction endodeoxyribonuclease RuvC